MLGKKLSEGMEVVQGSESAEVQTHYEGGTISKRKIRKRSKIRVSETKTTPEICVIGGKTRLDIFDNEFKLDRKYPKTT